MLSYNLTASPCKHTEDSLPVKTFSEQCFDQPSSLQECTIALILHLLQQYNTFPSLSPLCIWIPGTFLVSISSLWLLQTLQTHISIAFLLSQKTYKGYKPSWHFSEHHFLHHTWKGKQNQHKREREVTTLGCDHKQFLQLCLHPVVFLQ